MSVKSYELTDFFRQLSLLVKSGLPLPESLHNIAQNSSKREFRRIINDIAEQVANGVSLSDAFREQSFYFSEYQIKLIETGERTGSLAEVLKEVATTVQVNNRILNIIRGASYYPLLIIFIALCLVLALNYFIVGEFQNIFNELLAGEPLPPLTRAVMAFSSFITENVYVAVIVVALMPIFFIWLLGPSLMARRWMMKLVSILPFAREVLGNLMMARFCMTWATLMDRKVNDADSLKFIAESIGDARLSKTLYKVAAAVEAGGKPGDELRKTDAVSHLIPTILKHADEKDMSEELRSMADLFWGKAGFATKKLEVFWTAILIFIVTFFIGGTIIALFLPLTKIIEKLG